MTEDQMTEAAREARDGTIELVSAYVSNSNNSLSAEDLQSLIRETFATLNGLSGNASDTAEEPAEDHTKSKAEIRRSIGNDALISFEDGRSYKSLKRHLTTRGITPDQYRSKYGLPSDYPMTHPAYSARRSELAKAIGLGARGRNAKSGKPAAKRNG